jgi:hypothetical protein
VNAIPSALASEDWQLADGAARPASLIVQQRKQSYAFPYFRLVYAEGDDAGVRIAFSSHLVTVTGHGLDALLEAIAAQRVVRLMQPTENEYKFSVRGAGQAGIKNISVEATEE